MGSCHTKPRVSECIKIDCKKDNFNKVAKEAENNMIRILNESQDLKDWFLKYSPMTYIFDPHPKLELLKSLVKADGHSNSSFALTCQSVRRKFLKECVDSSVVQSPRHSTSDYGTD